MHSRSQEVLLLPGVEPWPHLLLLCCCQPRECCSSPAPALWGGLGTLAALPRRQSRGGGWDLSPLPA